MLTNVIITLLWRRVKTIPAARVVILPPSPTHSSALGGCIMKHSYGRSRNSVWRVINTRAFAVHYHVALYGRSISFRSRVRLGRARTHDPASPCATRFSSAASALSRSEDELSSTPFNAFPFDSFSRTMAARMPNFPGGNLSD